MSLQRLFLILTVIFTGTLLCAQYKLKPGDQLEVFNYAYPELSQQALVGIDGCIQVKMVGTVNVTAMTVDQLAQTIKEKLITVAPESRITVLLTQMFPSRIFILGEVKNPQAIDITFEQNLTLLNALSYCGGPTPNADVQNILIQHGNQTFDRTDLSATIEYGLSVNPVILLPGDTVVLPRKYERRVYVFGNMDQSGAVYFEEKEPMTLEILLAKMKYDTVDLERVVELIRDGEKTQMDIQQVFSQSQNIALRSNDIVIIKRIQPKYVYVSGLESQGKISFEKEETMNLQNLFGKLSMPNKQIKTLRVIHPDGTIDSIEVTDQTLLRNSLIVGDIVEFPTQNFVYVSGNVSKTGKIDFSFQEAFTLENLLAVLGIGEFESMQVQITYPDGQKFLYPFPESRKKSIPLQIGAFVEFPYKKFVYVTGEIPSITTPQIFFPNEENMSLKNALAKVNPDFSENRLNVTVIRGKDQYRFDVRGFFESDTDFALFTADILLLEKEVENYIVVISTEQEMRKLFFLPGESMNVLEVLTKFEKIGDFTGDQIKIVFPSGRVLLASVEKTLSLEENFELEPKSVVIIQNNQKRVFVLGNSEVSGEILFKPSEVFTLTRLVAKCNANIGKETQSIWIKDSKGVSVYEPSKVLEPNFEVLLEKDSVVYFKPYVAERVYVFGQVNNPGVITFEKSEPLNLITVFSKCGGFAPDASKTFKLITPTGKIEFFDYNALLNPEKIVVEAGSYFIAEDNFGQYAVLLGDVKTPGITYLQKSNLTLLELLSSRGGVLDWTLNTTIVLTRKDGRKELINLDLDPSILSTTNIHSGDTVFVLPSDRLKVFVFGSVIDPGIVPYRAKLSLLEALLFSGGPSATAFLKKVLVFSGGIESNPIVVDYSNFRKEKGAPEILLEPGDVVYVPQSALVDVKEIVTFLGSMITLVNSGFTFIDNLQIP